MPVRLETRFKDVQLPGAADPDAATLGAHLSGRLLGRYVRSTAHRVGSSERTRVLDRDVASRRDRAAGACRVAVAGAQPRRRTGGLDRGAVQAGEPGAEAEEGPPRRHCSRRLRTETPLSPAEEAPAAAFWRHAWLADGDASKLAAAHAALTTAVGAARAAADRCPLSARQLRDAARRRSRPAGRHRPGRAGCLRRARHQRAGMVRGAQRS